MKVALALRKSSAERYALVLGVQAYAREHSEIEIITVDGAESISWQQSLGCEPDAIIGFFHQAEQFEAVKRSNIPTVCINSVYNQDSIPVVCTDNVAVGRCAADFFLNQETVDLCFISNAHNHHYSKAREKGFFDQLTAHQRRATSLDSEEIETILPWIENQITKKRKTGLFCVNDACARALLNYLERLYPDITQFFTFLGADNDPFYYENGQTIFSSIEIDHRNVGYQALRVLHQNFTTGQPIPKKTEIPPLQAVNRSQNSLSHPSVLKALRYISKHYANHGLSPLLVAEKSNITVRGLNRLLKLEGKTPISQCIHTKRIAEAQRLIREQSKNFQQIAQLTGYLEYTTFYRSFLKITGYTPSDFLEASQTHPPECPDLQSS